MVEEVGDDVVAFAMSSFAHLHDPHMMYWLPVNVGAVPAPQLP